MDLIATLRKTAQIARERDQLTALPEGMERAADRIAELEAELREIAEVAEAGFADAKSSCRSEAKAIAHAARRALANQN